MKSLKRLYPSLATLTAVLLLAGTGCAVQPGGSPPAATYVTVIDNGRSLEATARELFVHPNTVRYRLKRVSEVIGWDATGPREALILQTALILGSIGTTESLRRRPTRRTP